MKNIKLKGIAFFTAAVMLGLQGCSPDETAARPEAVNLEPSVTVYINGKPVAGVSTGNGNKAAALSLSCDQNSGIDYSNNVQINGFSAITLNQTGNLECNQVAASNDVFIGQ